METYQAFLDRVSVFEIDTLDLGKSYFKGKASLAYKINENNKLKDFFGDTIVFDLDYETKRKISDLIDNLYLASPECFAERLCSDTLHMTLHDLSNSPCPDEISEAMEKNMTGVIERAPLVQNLKIKMRSNFIFNMVNTSIVLGLIPKDENEHRKLIDLYGLFDEVYKSDYPLTPHITLAYYSINGFNELSAKRLEATVNNLNTKTKLDIELDTNNLFYQRFTGMNKYRSIWNIGKNEKGST